MFNINDDREEFFEKYPNCPRCGGSWFSSKKDKHTYVCDGCGAIGDKISLYIGIKMNGFFFCWMSERNEIRKKSYCKIYVYGMGSVVDTISIPWLPYDVTEDKIIKLLNLK